MMKTFIVYEVCSTIFIPLLKLLGTYLINTNNNLSIKEFEKNRLSLTTFSTSCLTNSDENLHEKISLLISLISARWVSSVILFIITVLQCTEVLSLAELSKAICFSNLFYVSRKRKKKLKMLFSMSN